MSYLGRAVPKLYMEVHYLKSKKREKLPHGSDIAPAYGVKLGLEIKLKTKDGLSSTALFE